jgi:hypothetical protein
MRLVGERIPAVRDEMPATALDFHGILSAESTNSIRDFECDQAAGTAPHPSRR